MSYCVNCGVELDKSAKKCALCSTPVINPNEKNEPAAAEKPFSETLQLPKSIKKEFVAFAVSVIMLIPNIVMLFLNIFFIRQGFWSIYVLASSLLLWVLFVFPFFAKKRRPYLMWAFDTAAVGGFFFTVFALHGVGAVVTQSTLGIIALISVAVLLLIIWSRYKKHHWTANVIVFLVETTAVSFFAGLLTAYFTGNFNFFIVGIVISVCTLVMTAFFIYCNRSKHIRNWLNKAFYL